MYTLRIYGADYSEFDKFIRDWQVTDDNNTVVKWDDGILRNVLTCFLSKVSTSSKKLIINSRTTQEELEDGQLVSTYDKKRFGGLVGVISATFQYNKDDLYQNIDSIDATSIFPEPEDKIRIKVILQLQSRFDIEDNSRNHPFFLSTLLRCTDFKASDCLIPDCDDQLFEQLLLFVYIRRLKAAYVKGYYRTYQKFENNDDRFRGTLDVARHIRLNLGLNSGKISYSYKEKSIDNYLSHIIIEAYMSLKRRFPDLVSKEVDSDLGLSSIVHDLRLSIGYPKYDVRTLIAKNSSMLTHPYYTEYELLRDVCLRILRFEAQNVFDGEDVDVDGLLFYIPDLWEMYLECVLLQGTGSFVSQKPLSVFSQKKPDNFVQLTKPDFVYYYGCEPDRQYFMVLDAKFKEQWGNLIANGTSLTAAYLPDYDKCIRDMNTINAHATGAIFPTNIESLKNLDPSEIVHCISERNSSDRFYSFPVFVPSSKDTDYPNWYRAFENICMKTAEEIRKYVETEKKYYADVQALANQMSAIQRM